MSCVVMEQVFRIGPRWEHRVANKNIMVAGISFSRNHDAVVALCLAGLLGAGVEKVEPPACTCCARGGGDTVGSSLGSSLVPLWLLSGQSWRIWARFLPPNIHGVTITDNHQARALFEFGQPS